MLLEYRDPKFWQKFHKQHWKPELPTVIRNPFKQFPFTEEMVLAAMKEFQKRLERGDEKFRYLLPHSKRTAKAFFDSVFKLPNNSMEEFGRNCGRQLSKDRMGLMVNNIQSLDSQIWNSAAAFLQDAHPWIDFPMGRAIIDLFFGNYSESFLGLHKDMQQIFGFVVKGEKTILVWPFEYFLSRIKGLTPAARYFQMPLRIDYRKYRKDAIILKAQAGDVIYWSSDYWHIADGGTLDDYSIFLSLGLFRAATTSRPETKALNRFRKKILLRPRHISLVEKATLYSKELSPVYPKHFAARRLRWATGYAFPFGSPRQESEPIFEKTGKPMRFFKEPSTLLLWMVFRKEKKLLVSANGHWVWLSHSNKLTSLLKQIASNNEVSFSAVGRRPPIKINGSYWDNKGQLKTCTVSSKYDEVTTLLLWLVRSSSLRIGASHQNSE